MLIRRFTTSLKVAVVILWVVLMTLLVRQNLRIRSAVRLDTDFMGGRVDMRERWAGIYLRDKKIGYAHTEIKKIEDGYHVTENIFLDMTLMDIPQQITTQINAVTDRQLSLKIFSFRLRAGAVNFIAYGNVEGTLLKATIDAAGLVQKKTLRLNEPPVLSSNLTHAVLQQGLAPGTVLTRTFFDPATMQAHAIRVEVDRQERIMVHGTTYPCTKVRQHYDGLTVHAWIDDQGDTVKEESPMGLVLLRETEAQARGSGWAGRQDLLEATAIKIDGSFAKEGLTYLKLCLKQVDLAGLDIDGGRQRLTGNCVAVTLENMARDSTFRLPCARPEMREFLLPSDGVESDDDAIKSQAVSIIAGTGDAQKAVRLLMRWVYEHIEKRPTISIPSARAVLSARQGDCNEHAVLLAALCRAAGIPARVCAGIVFLRGGFYYHAWVEVHLGSWISVDPTMNQFPADVTHVRFVHGGTAQQSRILKLIGTLGIEIAEYL